MEASEELENPNSFESIDFGGLKFLRSINATPALVLSRLGLSIEASITDADKLLRAHHDRETECAINFSIQ